MPYWAHDRLAIDDDEMRLFEYDIQQAEFDANSNDKGRIPSFETIEIEPGVQLE